MSSPGKGFHIWRPFLILTRKPSIRTLGYLRLSLFRYRLFRLGRQLSQLHVSMTLAFQHWPDLCAFNSKNLPHIIDSVLQRTFIPIGVKLTQAALRGRRVVMETGDLAKIYQWNYRPQSLGGRVGLLNGPMAIGSL